MKKLSLTVIVVLIICLLSACQETYNCPTPMTPEKQKELGFDPDSWWSESNSLAKVRYYGTYNGYDILFSEGMSSGFMTISVAESSFGYHSGFQLYAHKDGVRISLEDAYEQGLVSKEDIAQACEYHKQGLESDKAYREAHSKVTEILPEKRFML